MSKMYAFILDSALASVSMSKTYTFTLDSALASVSMSKTYAFILDSVSPPVPKSTIYIFTLRFKCCHQFRSEQFTALSDYVLVSTYILLISDQESRFFVYC